VTLLASAVAVCSSALLRRQACSGNATYIAQRLALMSKSQFTLSNPGNP